MIYGIGVDLQNINQINDIWERQGEKFLRKIFTASEIYYCLAYRSPARHFAGRWAVKEAFFKALGTGVSNGYRFLDVETIRKPSGKPELTLHGKSLRTSQVLDFKSFVSISHSEDYAIAQVILEI
ncbi:MAG: holo-ACP synthase [Bacillota bacterium]